MKIAITGATGFVGKQLVPLLLNDGATVLVVGRDTRKIRDVFPSVMSCGYGDIASTAKGFDLLLHLAALNNDVDASLEAFTHANVDLTLECAASARDAQIPCFLNVSSVHALDHANTSNYAATKRAAAEQLSTLPGIGVCTLFLPAVVGNRLSGKLSALDRLPLPLRSLLLSLLSALRPTVRIERLEAAVIELADRRGRSLPQSLLLSEGQERNIVFGVAKRAVDLAFALVVAGLFWWALIIIYGAVRLQSSGPGLFAQRRIGKGEREFTCYKFRTMYVGTPNAGTHEVSRSAVTPIGAFLRRSKLDELPQIWNIFRNEMSLIGPRPCLPEQSALIAERAARGVFGVKPGISGYAQIHGVDMSEPRRLAEWDERYLRLQSLLLDLRIILSTALGRGGGDRTQP